MHKIIGYSWCKKLQFVILSENNDIVATMNLQLDKAAAEKGRSLDNGDDMDEQVHKLLQQSVGSGRVGNLKVDPQYLVFEPQSGEYKSLLIYLIETDSSRLVFSAEQLQ